MANKDDFNTQMKDLTDRLENGILELFESEKYKSYLKTMSKFTAYSTRNVRLIHLQMPDASRVAGYNSWDKNFGRHVNKGEKGIRIYAPIGNRQKEEKQKLDLETNIPLLNAEGAPDMEEVEKPNPRFKLIPVFDVSQTSGRPLPVLAEDLTGDVAQYDAFMAALAAVSPFPIGFESLPENTDGECRYNSRTIVLREGMSETQTVSAAIHEMAHALLHERKAATPAIESESPKATIRQTEEVEAESVSYAVCQYYGIETGANSFGYVANWSESVELPELKASLDTIRKTAGELISGIDARFREICAERGIDLSGKPEEIAQPQPLAELPEPAQVETVAPEAAPMEPATPEPVPSEPASRYTKLQQQGFEIARRHEHLPMQDRLNVIAETFGCKTGSIRTNPCGGKWRGTSDIFIDLDNGASLGIGNYRTPRAKSAQIQNECVNNTLARYNPEILAEAKTRILPALMRREAADNAVAAQMGLKPYTVLNVEMNDGSDAQSSGYLGWYYVTAAVDGKIFALIETGLNYDIAKGALSASRPDYFVAGGVKDNETDFVFDHVGHSSTSHMYKLNLTDAARERAEQTLAARNAERAAEKQYDIGMGHMGNGLTVWNRLEERDGDYVKIAHIGPDRHITYYDDNLPDAVKAQIEKEARESDMTISATQDARVFDTPPQAAAERTPTYSQVGNTPEPEQAAASDALNTPVILPDPAISLSERDAFGYTYADMLPLTADRALELYDADMTVYTLYEDSTEAMVFERDEILSSEGGIFGIERNDWEKSAEYARMAAESGEPARESAFIHGHEDAFGIYQLKGGEELRYHRFASLAQLEKDSLAVERGNYALVYTAPLENGSTLDGIYEKFNIDHPPDFRGHSLSVSDVVVLQQGGAVSSHYVDNFGFADLPAFLGNETQRETATAVQAQSAPQPPTGPTVAELEAQVKAGGQISLLDLARAVKKDTQLVVQATLSDMMGMKKDKPSILTRLQETRKTAVQGQEQPKNEPKRNSEREV